MSYVQVVSGSGDEAKPRFQQPTNLGIDEYHNYRVALDNARAQIKGDYERAKSREANLRVDLLDKYHKLYTHEKAEQKLVHDAKNAGFSDDGLLGGTENILQTLVQSDDQKENEARQRKMYLKTVLSECETTYEAYSVSGCIRHAERKPRQLPR